MLKKKASKKSVELSVRIQPVINARTAVVLEDVARKYTWNIGQTIDYLANLEHDYARFKAAIEQKQDMGRAVADFISAVTETVEITNLKR